MPLPTADEAIGKAAMSAADGIGLYDRRAVLQISYTLRRAARCSILSTNMPLIVQQWTPSSG